MTQTAAQNPSLTTKLRSQLSGQSRQFLAKGVGEHQHNKVDKVSSQVKNQQKFKLSPQQHLNILENVLDEVGPLSKKSKSTKSIAASSAPGRKESVAAGFNPAEQAASIQYVEEEKSPEISPEVEKYLNEVKQDQEKAPKEIVIASADLDLPSQDKYVSEPVIVLPITPEIEKRGKRKSPKFSIRWLVEWSQKVIKMFAGKVVYRQVEA